MAGGHWGGMGPEGNCWGTGPPAGEGGHRGTGAEMNEGCNNANFMAYLALFSKSINHFLKNTQNTFLIHS